MGHLLLLHFPLIAIKFFYSHTPSCPQQSPGDSSWKPFCTTVTSCPMVFQFPNCRRETGLTPTHPHTMPQLCFGPRFPGPARWCNAAPWVLWEELCDHDLHLVMALEVQTRKRLPKNARKCSL